MRVTILLAACALAACGRDSAERGATEPWENDGRREVRAPSSAEPSAGASRQGGNSVQTADLTGLYEAGEGGQRGRMCMIRDAAGATTFGIATEGAGSCGGAGVANRTGDVLRLTMAGDQQCVIQARIAGTRVTFPARVHDGCAYYCGPGASLAGQTFEKTGGTRQEAMSATDLAGDPLCG